MPNTLLPAGVLSDLATVVTDSLPDTCVNSRTGLTVACRVSDSTSGVRIHRPPELMHVRQYEVMQPATTDCQIGDRLTVSGSGAGTYLAMWVEGNDSLPISKLAQCVKVGSIAASILGQPGALTPGTTGRYTTKFASITVRPVDGLTFLPVAQQFLQDMFGVQAELPAKVYVDWPVGSTADLPIVPKDQLKIGTKTYNIVGVEPYPPSYLALYVELPVS